MSLEFIELKFRNFMSFGNTFESIKFDAFSIAQILGENLDQIGTKNGTGKSSIGHALSWVLFGNAIGNKVKKPNLVNKTNKKNMEGSLTFKKNGSTYRIERGRSPEYLKWFCQTGNTEVDLTDASEAQGENAKTQEEINKVLGFSADMFYQAVLLTPLTTPFMMMNTGQQRSVIEELLGVTRLSEKASVLRDLLRDTKQSIEIEDAKIKALQQANERIKQGFIDQQNDLRKRSEQFQAKKQRELIDLSDAISGMQNIDIDRELKLHVDFKVYQDDVNEQSELKNKLSSNEKELKAVQKDIDASNSRIVDLDDNLLKLDSSLCPTCGQHVHDSSDIREEIVQKKTTYQEKIRSLTTKKNILHTEIESIQERLSVPEITKPEQPFYSDIQLAHDHRLNLDALQTELNLKQALEDPYLDQLADLKDPPIQEIDFDTKSELCSLRDHQEFLLKILTSKDSYVRKRIVEQSLQYLNHRLAHYLERMNFPFEVKFQSDLEVTIQYLGNEYDYSQLSTGQRGRVSIGLTLAFRDVFESINSPVNLLFIDEVLDREGLCAQGVEQILEILKHMARDRAKRIFIVSHNPDLQARVQSSIKVVMESGFSSIILDQD